MRRMAGKIDQHVDAVLPDVFRGSSICQADKLRPMISRLLQATRDGICSWARGVGEYFTAVPVMPAEKLLDEIVYRMLPKIAGYVTDLQSSSLTGRAVK